MGDWLPTRRGIVKETVATVIGGGIMWVLLRGFDLAGLLRPSAPDLFLMILGGLLLAGIVHVLDLRRRFDPEVARQAKHAVKEVGAARRAELSAEERAHAHDLRAEARQKELDDLDPLVTWAKGLIERERDTNVYVRIDPERVAITNAAHLDDLEPYFQIVIGFEYIGTGRIIVGERCSGSLSWNQNNFAREPKVTIGLDKPPPFEGIGPTVGEVRLTQHVGNDLRDYMKSFFEKKPREVQFWIQKFNISLRIEAFDGEVLYDGELLPGDYLTVKARY